MPAIILFPFIFLPFLLLFNISVNGNCSGRSKQQATGLRNALSLHSLMF